MNANQLRPRFFHLLVLIRAVPPPAPPVESDQGGQRRGQTQDDKRRQPGRVDKERPAAGQHQHIAPGLFRRLAAVELVDEPDHQASAPHQALRLEIFERIARRVDRVPDVAHKGDGGDPLRQERLVIGSRAAERAVQALEDRRIFKVAIAQPAVNFEARRHQPGRALLLPGVDPEHQRRLAAGHVELEHQGGVRQRVMLHEVFRTDQARLLPAERHEYERGLVWLGSQHPGGLEHDGHARAVIVGPGDLGRRRVDVGADDDLARARAFETADNVEARRVQSVLPLRRGFAADRLPLHLAPELGDLQREILESRLFPRRAERPRADRPGEVTEMFVSAFLREFLGVQPGGSRE